MNFNQAQILHLLLNGERYGNQILKDFAGEFGREIKRPTLYSLLEKLEDERLVTHRMGADTHARGGARRQYFKITAAGESALNEFLAQVRPLTAR